MTDLATLHNRIATLAAVPDPRSGNVRDLLRHATSDPLEALLQELNETQIARCLTFENDRGEQLVLDVTSGRILQVGAATSPELFLQPNPGSGIELTDANEVEIAAFAKLCAGFLDDVTQLTVASSQPCSPPDPSKIGLAIDRAFVQKAATTETDTPQETLSAQIKSRSTAFVRIDGTDVLETTGQQPYRERLLALAHDEIASRNRSKTIPDTQHFVLLSTLTEEDLTAPSAVICAALSKSAFFATFPAKDTIDILGFWAAFRTDTT